MLRERAMVLCYTYVAYLVNVVTILTLEILSDFRRRSQQRINTFCKSEFITSSSFTA